MIAEVCRFYGWTDEYVLSMPAQRFFAILKTTRELRNREMREACDIQAISICNSEYYSRVRDAYTDKSIATLKPNTYDYSDNEEEAKHAMFALFAGGKG